MLRKDQYHFGMDADIKEKFAAKYDPSKAAAVKTWLEALTKKSLTGNLVADLKSGVVLCEAVNAIAAGSVPQINRGNQPFVQRENIVSYLNACKKLGMVETDLFVTQDLFEGDNIVVVIDQILALGVIAKNRRGFHGPQIVVGGGQVKVEAVGAGAGYRPAAAPAPAPAPRPVPAASKPAAAPAPKAAAVPASAVAGPKFCSNCGTARAGAGKFCSNCGTPF